MSLSKVYGRGKDRYLELINGFPLRPIKDDTELDDAICVIDTLIDKARLSRAEQDYLEAISVFVEVYEEKMHPIDAPSDEEMLRHLIDAKNVTQSQVSKDTDIAESTISGVLNGKRRLTRNHIAQLASYFGVSQGVFELGS